MAQSKQKLIMLDTNSYIYFFCIFFIQIAAMPLGGDSLPVTFHVEPSATPIKVPKKPWSERIKKLENVKTTVIDATTKAMHDTSDAITGLKGRLVQTVKHEACYAHSIAAPTILAIPYYYYGGAMLLYYASRHELSYNIQVAGGILFIVALLGNFIRWNMQYVQQMENKKPNTRNDEDTNYF